PQEPSDRVFIRGFEKDTLRPADRDGRTAQPVHIGVDSTHSSERGIHVSHPLVGSTLDSRGTHRSVIFRVLSSTRRGFHEDPPWNPPNDARRGFHARSSQKVPCPCSYKPASCSRSRLCPRLHPNYRLNTQNRVSRLASSRHGTITGNDDPEGLADTAFMLLSILIDHPDFQHAFLQGVDHGHYTGHDAHVRHCEHALAPENSACATAFMGMVIQGSL
ncbi:hypothetical protein PSTT_04721, partial [Puccinia striiformis]